MSDTSTLAPAAERVILELLPGESGSWPVSSNERGTMNRVSTDVVKPHLRGYCLPRLRTVAAAGSLLDYWTDFGRLLTKLP